ncbi:MAG: bifunctional deaminase-reductase domain protein [Candidatus Taylorbacteria bacterium]|nr:bifunctional deaminase-reductase domain protein [Candidatus Taylorbacteria bacterium]
MKKITVFNFISVDGYYAGPNDEIDWFKAIGKDAEYDAYTHSQSSSNHTLMFGHTTYDMMKSFWPTPMAMESDPHMAKIMNESMKIVFSKELQHSDDIPGWDDVIILRDIRAEEILKLKRESAHDITILGSGSIVQQLSNLGLIDSYQLMVVPIVLGAGKSLFANAKSLNLKLLEAKSFKNGVVSLQYEPMR